MLSDEWIMDMVSQQCTAMLDGKQKEISPITIARAIEAEVRKHDDALILQLVEALDDLTEAGEEAWSEERPCVRIGKKAITAGRARLGDATSSASSSS